MNQWPKFVYNIVGRCHASTTTKKTSSAGWITQSDREKWLEKLRVHEIDSPETAVTEIERYINNNSQVFFNYLPNCPYTGKFHELPQNVKTTSI